jgi:hypothetical protein
MKFKFVLRFHHCLNVRKRSSEKIVYHTLNVFRLRLKASKSVSLLRDIGKEFQSLGAQVEKALPTNDLSLKDSSDRRCFDSEHSEQAGLWGTIGSHK